MNSTIQRIKQQLRHNEFNAPQAVPPPQISLPINNMEKENKISNDDLDLGFWGGVVERAERAARSNDNGKKTLIAGMLDMAKNAITGAEKTSTPAAINAYNGENSSYSVNILNTGTMKGGG